MRERSISRRAALSTAAASLAAAALPSVSSPADDRHHIDDPLRGIRGAALRRRARLLQEGRARRGKIRGFRVASRRRNGRHHREYRHRHHDPIQLANAYVHNLPLRLIGWCGQSSSKAPQPALFVARTRRFARPRTWSKNDRRQRDRRDQFARRRVSWLSKNSVDVKKVRPIEVRSRDSRGAAARDIDAGVLGEPFITSAADNIRMLAPAFDVMGPHWSICVWFSRLDYIRSQQPLIARCMAVAYETARYVNAHPEATNPIIAKYSKISPETIAAMRHTEFAEAPNPDSARIELDYAYQFKLLPRRVTVEDLMSTA